MKPIPVFIATWALAGLGAVIGSALGSGAGKPGLFGGALVGGVLGVVAAVLVLTKLQWLLAEDRRGALVGGIAGFAVAAPIAVTHLHTPLTPVRSQSHRPHRDQRGRLCRASRRRSRMADVPPGTKGFLWHERLHEVG